MLWCLSWHQSQRCERCRELRPVRKSAAPSRDLVFFLAATAAIDESSSVRSPRNFCNISGLRPPEWYTRVVHMTLTMARPWKHPKTGLYWLRKRVPDALRGKLGRREINGASVRAIRRKQNFGTRKRSPHSKRNGRTCAPVRRN